MESILLFIMMIAVLSERKFSRENKMYVLLCSLLLWCDVPVRQLQQSVLMQYNIHGSFQSARPIVTSLLRLWVSNPLHVFLCYRNSCYSMTVFIATSFQLDSVSVFCEVMWDVCKDMSGNDGVFVKAPNVTSFLMKW